MSNPRNADRPLARRLSHVDATSKLAESVSLAALLALTALLLTAVGQPLFTDDTWWHLALGRAYAQQGPWLAADPLLFAAPGPLLPAAWLSDLLLYATHQFAGFAALRTLHVAMVAGIVALSWSLLARASGSRLLANAGTAVFLCVASYRLVQLRPHLFTMLATLLLYRMLFADPQKLSARRLAAAIALLALWANLHAAFVLGPVLVAAGLAAIALGEALKPAGQRNFRTAQLRQYALALVLGGAATCLNPAGIGPHLAYLLAGDETPGLARVGDEWSRVDLFSLPAVGGLPSPIAWLALWLLLAGTAAILAGAIARWQRGDRAALARIDLVPLLLSGVAFAASLAAVRFLWLLLFPLLLLAAWGARAVAPLLRRSLGARACASLAAALLVPAFVWGGDWPIISRGVSTRWPDYARDYPAEKYHAHAVWLLDDAELRGNLFADYYLGGFLGYWLAPEMRAFVNGSLNVSRDAIASNLPIRERRGARAGESFAALLERQRVDVFLGIRLPRPARGARPWFHTTAHLEGERGWIAIFRNLNSSLYVRDNARNRLNLERVAAYYRSQGIAFEATRGFDPLAVAEQSPAWAVAHGLVPQYYAQLVAAANDRASRDHLPSLNLLASVYSALGAYPRSIEIDRQLLRLKPAANAASRRLVWCLLRLHRYGDAALAAESLAAQAPTDALSQQIVAIARATATPHAAGDLDARIARLPVFTPAEARRLKASMARPEVRKSGI